MNLIPDFSEVQGVIKASGQDAVHLYFDPIINFRKHRTVYITWLIVGTLFGIVCFFVALVPVLGKMVGAQVDSMSENDFAGAGLFFVAGILLIVSLLTWLFSLKSKTKPLAPAITKQRRSRSVVFAIAAFAMIVLAVFISDHPARAALVASAGSALGGLGALGLASKSSG